MDLTAVTVRVQASRLLTETEKMYWIQHLPRMNADQIATLESILSQAEGLQWTASVPDFQAASALIPTPA